MRARSRSSRLLTLRRPLSIAETDARGTPSASATASCESPRYSRAWRSRAPMETYSWSSSFVWTRFASAMIGLLSNRLLCIGPGAERDDECLRGDGSVGQAHADRPHSEVVGALPRSIMQDDVWLAVWRGQHLNLSPAETTKSGTEHLRNSLFRCEARGKAVHAAGTERDLLRRERALEEPITSDIDSPLELVELDSINARPDDASRGPIGWHHLGPREGTRGAHGVAPSAAWQSSSNRSTLSYPRAPPRVISAVADAETQVSSPAGKPLSCATNCSTRPRPR